MNNLYNIKNKIIAVDFDNTLTYAGEYPKAGNINKNMINLLKHLQSNNNKIILWTCRCDNYLLEAINMCQRYNFTFDAINENINGNNTSNKIFADYYIDDKAININDINFNFKED